MRRQVQALLPFLALAACAGPGREHANAREVSGASAPRTAPLYVLRASGGG